MKLKVIIFAAIAFLAASATSAQSVRITGKEVTYTRKNPIVDFKKTFTITYPKITASSPALSKKIEAALSYEKILSISVKDELNDVQWLEDADFKVEHNGNGILCLALSMNGTGAYPSGTVKYVTVDIRTGNRLNAADIFRNLAGLTAMLRKAQKLEIKTTIAELKRDPETRDPDPASLFESADYKAADLENYSVNAKGVTFYYDYGFPHAIQAMQPAGNFGYTWRQLKPFIKPGGLLAKLAR